MTRIDDVLACTLPTLGLDDRTTERRGHGLVFIKHERPIDFRHVSIHFHVERAQKVGRVVVGVHAEDASEVCEREAMVLGKVGAGKCLDSADAYRGKEVLCEAGHEVSDVGTAHGIQGAGEEVRRRLGVAWLPALLEQVGALDHRAECQSPLQRRC